jgi:hypothetical protein
LGRSRRECLALLAAAPLFASQNGSQRDSPSTGQKDRTEPAADAGDWTCPMDRDVHLNHPGTCPRCGMKLLLKIPERVEYPLSLTVEPAAIRPGDEAHLTLRVFDPENNRVQHFETVHEKLVHLFVVSEDLEFFAHVHPVLQPDGSFIYQMRLPKSGMYRLLADYYPTGSTPQLAVETLYVQGPPHSAHLLASLAPQVGENLTASLRLEPVELTAGLEARLYYTLEPGSGLEKYLGAWAHMLIASEDLVDLIHLHPFLTDGANIQFNMIFPRPGNYKIWSQFQRLGVVNTIAFCVKVTGI